MKHIWRLVTLGILAIVLASCGGGTGTSAPDNDKPGGGNVSPPVDALLVQIKVLGTATAINAPLEFTAEISGTEAKMQPFPGAQRVALS